MAFSYSPKIVTDGLVLYLDAANPYSYVSGSTAWNDLSRTQTSGSLVNEPTYNSGNGGSIVFDGVDDYYITTNSTALDCVDGVSAFVWIKSPSSYISKEILMKYNLINPVIPYGFQWWNDRNVYFHITSTTGWLEVTGLVNYNLNTWYYLGLTYDKINLKTYVNRNVTSTIAKTGPLTTNSIPVQCSPGVGSTFSNIQIYNRALTSDEIQQNYNATKGRFGL